VLAHLEAIQHLPDSQPNLILAAQAVLRAPGRRDDPIQFLLGGRQQRLALPRPLLREQRIAAGP
jgi:ABC-type Fe3+/spermidine/putrescine transport system ATPase subunit